MSPLERRYRRLLVAYPRAYRIAYGDEMVGVLMDSAGPDQRHPSASDALHLLRHGLLSRARRLPSLPGRALRFDSPQWSRAAGVFAFLGAVLMTAKHAYLLAQLIGFYTSFAWYAPDRFPREHVVLGCLWLAAAAALWLHLPRVGAAIVGIAALGELVVADTSGLSVNAAAVMRLTAAVLITVAALLGRRTPISRGWWMLTIVAAAALFAATGELVDTPRAPVLASLFVAQQTLYAGVAVLLTLGWVLLRQPAPVRRRLLVFLAAPVAQLCAYQLWDSGYHDGPVLVPPALAVALICAAVLGPGLALLAVRRTERLSRLVALGREVEARAREAEE